MEAPVKWHVVERLGDKQALTNEGFLLIREVPIARIIPNSRVRS